MAHFARTQISFFFKNKKIKSLECIVQKNGLYKKRRAKVHQKNGVLRESKSRSVGEIEQKERFWDAFAK
jgi:hypothetical protein